MKFKEQWVQRDETCEHCGAVTKQAKGINKQNLKRLCLTKPTAQDWIMLFIWVSAIIIAFSYNTEIAQCKSVITNFSSLCAEYFAPSKPVDYLNTPGIKEIPYENFTLNVIDETQER